MNKAVELILLSVARIVPEMAQFDKALPPLKTLLRPNVDCKPVALDVGKQLHWNPIDQV